jgi:hypothetical protein
MVFDLPLFRLKTVNQANPCLDSALPFGPSATAEGGSETAPYSEI